MQLRGIEAAHQVQHPLHQEVHGCLETSDLMHNLPRWGLDRPPAWRRRQTRPRDPATPRSRPQRGTPCMNSLVSRQPCTSRTGGGCPQSNRGPCSAGIRSHSWSARRHMVVYQPHAPKLGCHSDHAASGARPLLQRRQVLLVHHLHAGPARLGQGLSHTGARAAHGLTARHHRVHHNVACPRSDVSTYGQVMGSPPHSPRRPQPPRCALPLPLRPGSQAAGLAWPALLPTAAARCS